MLRYKIDKSRLPARLAPDADPSATDGPVLVVTDETDCFVSRREAQQDCELISATAQELADLRGAGYDIPRARDFIALSACQEPLAPALGSPSSANGDGPGGSKRRRGQGGLAGRGSRR